MKKNTTPANLVGQASDEDIKKWKEAKENAIGIYSITVGGHIVYLRNPDVDALNIAASAVTKDTPLDYFATIAEETYVGGSKEVWEDPKKFLDFIETIKPKLEGKKGQLLDL